MLLRSLLTVSVRVNWLYVLVLHAGPELRETQLTGLAVHLESNLHADWHRFGVKAALLWALLG